MSNHGLISKVVSTGYALAMGPGGEPSPPVGGGIIQLLAILLFAIFLIKSVRKWRKKYRAIESLTQPVGEPSIKSFPVRIIEDQVHEEKQVVIGVEEMPLDNRYGTSTVVSEHEFTRTEKTHLTVEETKNVQGLIKGGIWSLIEAEIKNVLSKTLAVEIGGEISRRVTLKLEAPPGKMVRYRISWKQTKRVGSIKLVMGKKTFDVPYTINHGLFHSLESLSESE